MNQFPTYAEALERILPRVVPISREQPVPLHSAHGCTLARAIHADRDLPPFNRSMMDGYAMRIADATGSQPLEVIGEVPAGTHWQSEVPQGSCVAIATGAPVPEGLDCVVQHEWTDRGDPLMINLPQPIKPGHAIHHRGEDARHGDVLIAPGTRLEPHHLGIAASVGVIEPVCITPPRVTILTSGDEVLPPQAAVEAHQIRNSNGIMLSLLLHRMGGHILCHKHLADQQQATIAAVAEALGTSDIVITVGGISAGQRDYFHDAYRALELDQAIGGAAIQPGKPITIGHTAHAEDDGDAWIVSLPGNPVSSLACACLFIWPIIECMLSRSGALPWRSVTLAESVRPNARRQAFRPAIITGAHREQVSVPNWAGSGDLAHTTATNGLAELPVQTDEVPAGTTLRFLPWPGSV